VKGQSDVRKPTRSLKQIREIGTQRVVRHPSRFANYESTRATMALVAAFGIVLHHFGIDESPT
jgi:hypothetical protein